MANDLVEFEKLEGALVRVGREMDYPATPAIAARVREELMLAQSTAPRNWLRLLAPVAVAIVLALILLVALPTARDAVGQFLGLRGLQIFYVTPTPELTKQPTAVSTVLQRMMPTKTPRPTVTPTRAEFMQCCETTLAEAQRRASFTLKVPLHLTPSKVYYQSVFDSGEQVIMVFGAPANPQFTLYQAQRWIYGKIIGNELSGQTLLSETTVKSERALWFSGAPHILVLMNRNGQRSFEVERVVKGNTLVWETGNQDLGIIYRIETNLSLAEAKKFAERLVEVTR